MHIVKKRFPVFSLLPRKFLRLRPPTRAFGDRQSPVGHTRRAHWWSPSIRLLRTKSLFFVIALAALVRGPCCVN